MIWYEQNVIKKSNKTPIQSIHHIHTKVCIFFPYLKEYQRKNIHYILYIISFMFLRVNRLKKVKHGLIICIM